jgi:hypothetical protein
MEPIANTEELQTKRAGEKGYIYNDDQGGVEMHVFHRATCTTLALAKVPPRKWFSLDLQDAVNWLNAYRGEEDVNWHRCSAGDPLCF